MPRIVVVDDDHDILDTSRLVLEAEGFEVETADNPDDGFKLIETKNPDLIILDVMMNEPDDGFFLAQKIRRKEIKTPVLMYTSISKSMGYDFDKGEVVPVDDFVEKPITPEQLIEKVKNLLSAKGE